MFSKIKNFIRNALGNLLFYILLKKKREDEMYILLHSHIGDLLYALSFVDDLNEYYKTKKVVWVINKKYAYLLEGYSSLAKVVITPDLAIVRKLFNFLFNSEVLPEKGLEKGIINTSPWYYRTLRQSSDGIFSILQNDLFRLPEHKNICYRKYPQIDIQAIENFEQIKSRVVVINGYSLSMSGNRALFENIADLLIKKGYYVFSNVIGEQKEIKGTQPLRCSIDELYNIMKECFLFVSIRSGIVDAMIPSRVKMFVIYQIDDPCSDFLSRNFHLGEWKNGADICEVEIREKSDEEGAFSTFVKYLERIEV